MLRAITAWMLAMAVAIAAAPQNPRPDQARFRDLFKEMVETNTSLSGSCTALAEKIAVHLKDAGYSASNIHQFSAPDHPKEGGIVAVLPGANPRLKAILL